MRASKQSFRHESLQDGQSIQELLKALSAGLAAGRLELSDVEDQLVLKPEGLLHLKVTASQEDNQNRINLRVTWQSKDKQAKKKSALNIKGG